jgi:SAM-dependent methyltransferase
LRGFDVVCATEVIEHAADPKRFVATAASLVKPGGLLLVSTLNRTLRSFALAIVGAEYVLRWLEPGTHRWEQFVTPLELTGFAPAAGLRRRSLRGMVYDPFRRDWRLSSDSGVNYDDCSRHAFAVTELDRLPVEKRQMSRWRRLPHQRPSPNSPGSCSARSGNPTSGLPSAGQVHESRRSQLPPPDQAFVLPASK